MMSIKKKIKQMLPERLIYVYECLKKIPQYILSIMNESENEFPNIKFLDDKATVDRIIMQGMSLSRFGDGEFMWMSGERLDSFQEYSEQFAEDLRMAFQSQNPKLLIGIPHGIFDSKECNLYAKMHWKIIKQKFLLNLEKFVDIERVYCNASITRPYIDYKKVGFSEEAFKNLKRIWENRDIVIIEGKQTKLGMGNDLFDNALSIKRILCPSVNAYSKIEEIKSSIRKNVDKETMILGALGPTASILAVQLADEGYQFVDIGHIDVEYMWYLKKTILRVPIEGKYVNESGEKECSDFYEYDKKYLNSIMDEVL